jgi:enoyl-CoA hydratase
MAYDTITLSVADGIATLTVNRPDKLNALNERVIAELGEAIDAVREDVKVRGVILTGAGRAFVAGADISELEQHGAISAKMLAQRGQDVFRRFETSPKPTIAAVNGFALGGGCELAMACHVRIASDTAKFGQPEVKLGLIPGYGGTQRLPRLIGESRAIEVILTGRTIEAEEAERIGLVNRLVEGDLTEAGMAFAREMTGYSLPVLNLARDAIRRALDLPLPEGLKNEADLSTLAFQTADSIEGMTAFIEKRKPVFRDG